MKETRIMIVDDDPSIRKFVRANLEARGYKVLLAADGEEALQIIERELPDLILLDIMMPKMDGFTVCRRLREWSNIPILMLTARDNENDKVRCLDAGADDYITKPFSLRELLSRIKAILRRSNDSIDPMTVKPRYVYDGLEIDLARKRVFINEKEILLSPTAYRMLSYLAINAGKVITANQLLDEVWGEKYFGDTHIVQVGMARLRKNLEDNSRKPKYIETRKGIGYLLKACTK